MSKEIVWWKQSDRMKINNLSPSTLCCVTLTWILSLYRFYLETLFFRFLLHCVPFECHDNERAIRCRYIHISFYKNNNFVVDTTFWHWSTMLSIKKVNILAPVCLSIEPHGAVYCAWLIRPKELARQHANKQVIMFPMSRGGGVAMTRYYEKSTDLGYQSEISKMLQWKLFCYCFHLLSLCLCYVLVRLLNTWQLFLATISITSVPKICHPSILLNITMTLNWNHYSNNKISVNE